MGALSGDSAYPCASSTAGANSSPSGLVPYRSCSAAQPAGAPGTVTGSQPLKGTASPCPSASTRSRVSLSGENPDEFSPCKGSPFMLTIAKQSPPTPLLAGSTTVSAAATASAASTALPPSCRTCSPACVASGCDEATMPRCPYTRFLLDAYG